MQIVAIVLALLLLVCAVLTVVSDMKRMKESKSMTLELFERRLVEIKQSRNGGRFIRFMKDNSVFIKEHETEVAEIFARVFPKAADSNN